jgi:putative ABC transport system permease protein
MFKNYLILALRNSLKNSTTSLINFLGLTIGLISCFLIYLNVTNELSYDRFHTKAERTFRILSIDKALGISNNNVGITIPALAPGMKQEIPEVENVVRINGSGRSLVKYKDRTLYSKDLIYTEPSFFDVFDFKLKEGDPVTCLQNPNTALLTESMAKKIFGEENPMGKIFSADGTDNLQVTGILKDETRNSHCKFDIILSINPSPSDTNTQKFLESWNNIAMSEYVTLKDPSKSAQVITEMDSLMRRHKVIDAWTATLQPLKEVHLYSNDILFDNFNQEKGNIRYVQSLSLIALIIILIACFNYMNLSTARSARRAKEVGLRKTVGATRGQLIFQYLSEAYIQVFLAMLVSLAAVELINNLFYINGTGVLAHFIQHPLSILYIILLGLLLGTLSGLYPALILSSFIPQIVLKGKFVTGKNGLWLRRILVSSQFIATFIMIVGTIIVLEQLNYSLNKDKGFDSTQIINLQLDNDKTRENYTSLKTEFEKIPGIQSIATSGSMPGLGFGRNGITPEGAQTTDTWIVSAFSVDENYIPLMKMELVEGDNFRRNMSDEPLPVIVNESLVKATGWGKGLNKTITFGNKKKAVVIGVVKDFHFTSLRHKIEPVIMIYRSGVNQVVSIKAEGKSMGQTLAAMESKWNKLNTGIPFEYKFYDESFRELFTKEQDFSKLFLRFTLLSIFVAILGLFGLAAFSAEQRTREIGIRKTFGGTTRQMILLQSGEYTRLVVLAMAIGLPAAIYLMHQWLQGFEYKIHLNAYPFFISVMIILLVTFITVSLQAFKAAQKNPSETLKYE